MSSRRNFLRSAGLGLGAAITSVPFSSKSSEINKNSYKVGILLPTSTTHVEYPESFSNGINLAFNNLTSESHRFESIIESVKFGYPLQAIKKAQKLVNENHVDFIVGLLNTEVAYSISQITGPAKIPTLIANAGENFPNKEMVHNPYLFYNTLNLYSNSAIAGKYMVENFGKKLAVVSGLHDCGYDTIYAFRQAVEESGGTITNVFINKLNNKEFCDQAISQLREHENDGLFLLMNGQEANNFLQVYHREKVAIPIVTTSFVPDEKKLHQMGETVKNVYHLSSWIKNLDNIENKKFVSEYRNEFKTDPDQFSFLGFQSGLIAEQIKNNSRNESASEILLNTPAGQVTINSKTGEVESPAFLCKTLQGNFSLPENTVLKKIHSKVNIENILITNKTTIHSGWLNPYLFV